MKDSGQTRLITGQGGGAVEKYAIGRTLSLTALQTSRAIWTRGEAGEDMSVELMRWRRF